MRDWGARDPRWSGVRSETLTLTSAGVNGDGPTSTDVHLLRAGDDRAADERTGEDVAPTLLVHGLGGNVTNWLDVIGALGERGPVVAVDLPGFGRTEPPDPRAARLRPQVRFLTRLLDALGWDRAVVHGNSMGGLLSVLLAAHVPDRVEALVLTSPALPPPRTPAGVSPTVALRFAPFVSWRFGGMVLERLYTHTPAEQIRHSTMQLVLGDTDDVRPTMREVQIENVDQARAEAWRLPAFARAATSLVHTLGVGVDVNRAIDEVEAPTLVVWGEQDRLVSRATIDAVCARRPDWHRVDLDGIGHVAMLEDADRWLDVVVGWLDRQRSERV